MPRTNLFRSRTRVSYYPLRGGEDLVSPAFSAGPGSLRSSLNYECDDNGRYRRLQGYEVFDGHPKPSDASYWILSFTDGNAEMTADDTVTGDSSGATGTLLEQVLESGTYAGGDAAGYLVLTNVSGVFEDDEDLLVSAVAEAVADGTAAARNASTDTLDSTYLQAAIEYARDQIAVPAGSGTPLGVWQYNGVKYCWRNNAGGTAAVMFKSTTSGWSIVDLGRTVAFTSGGTTEIAEDDTVTGATSGATAVVKRVILASGTWAGGDAAGTFVLYSQSGTFQSENLNVGATPNLATIAGNSTATTLAASGKVRCINANFYGSTDYYRMYGCDGKNKAFEFDGTTYVPITTGMAVDTPEHIFKFQNHLFLAFPGGSLQHSSLGLPYEWDPVTGATELGIGQEITGMFELPGPVFVIFARNRIFVLTGTSVDDWALSHYSLNSGGIEDTIQKISNGIYLDDRGVTTIATAQEFGDFKDAIISDRIQPLIDYKLKEGINAQCSVAVRSKNQYRLYFDDKTGVILTLNNGSVVGWTRQEYKDQFEQVVSTDDANGFEEVFACCDDGFIYQLDKGTSFDDDAVYAMLRTHFNHLKTPSHRKRLRKIDLELEAATGTEINLGVEYDYSETDAGGTTEFEIGAGGGLWGDVTWGDFTWGGKTVGNAELSITGSGRNFCIVITSEQKYVEPHTIQGVTVHYDIRGLKR